MPRKLPRLPRARPAPKRPTPPTKPPVKYEGLDVTIDGQPVLEAAAVYGPEALIGKKVEVRKATEWEATRRRWARAILRLTHPWTTKPPATVDVRRVEYALEQYEKELDSYRRTRANRKSRNR